ncbi:MAG: PAS domain-containing sensor histidine kinase [Anaerolineae bacterium]|nr:PAS domain-containing sensor histidine kinase [Anaerolineae bacterium]
MSDAIAAATDDDGLCCVLIFNREGICVFASGDANYFPPEAAFKPFGTSLRHIAYEHTIYSGFARDARQVIASGEPIARRVLYPPRPSLWLDVTLQPAGDGAASGCVCVLRYATVVVHRQRLLDSLQKRFDLLLAHSTDAVIVLNMSNQIALFNQAAEKMFGYPAAAMLGRPLDDLLPHGLAAVHRNHVEIFLKQPVTARPMNNRPRLEARRQDGSTFPVQISLIKSEVAGELVLFAIVRDVTQQERLRHDMIEALQREREALEEKTHFVSLVSHELKTPLSVILSSTDVLENYGPRLSEERRADHLRRIRAEVRRLDHMINDIVLLDRTGRSGTVTLIPVDVRLVVRGVVSHVESALDASGRVVLEMVNLPDTLISSPALLSSIMVNLLSNALKYSAHLVWLRLVYQPGDELMIVVRDRGIGIPLDEQDSLFKNFFRASNVAHLPGTGLGLVIVQRCVETLGGMVQFHSTPGEGTEFTVRLLSMGYEQAV